MQIQLILLFFGKNSPSISQSWKNKKQKTPLMRSRLGVVGWMLLMLTSRLWMRRSPNLLPTSGRNRSNSGLGSRPGVLDSLLESSLCVSSLDRGPPLFSLSWKLHEHYMQSAAVLRKLVQKKFGSQSKLAYISCLLAYSRWTQEIFMDDDGGLIPTGFE